MVRQLPMHDGYTIDERLRQFRKVTWDGHGNPSMEFIDFDTEEGEQLLRTLRMPDLPEPRGNE